MLNKTIGDKQVRFRTTPPKEVFVKALRDNIYGYFKENNISKHANTEMYIKMVLAFVFWFAVYAVIISDVLSHNLWLLFAAWSLLGFANIFIAFAIAHDAIHDAISSKPWVNQLLARSMDFVGGNSYLLRQMHGEHHRWVNIHEIDVTLETHGLFRFTPHEPWKPMHRFQHFYVPFLYSLAQFHWVTFKDFKWFFSESHIGNAKDVKHPLKEYAVLLISKFVYHGLTLVLPLMFLTVPWWIVVLGWFSIHVLSGLTFALIFQCTHVYNGTTYPMPDNDGNIENNYAIHVVDTTADFSRTNRIGSWLMGSINIHIVHHIFPDVCHVHYPKLTPILMKTCEEYGLEYKEYKTFPQAFAAHIGMLKHLSRPDSVVPEYNTNLSMAAEVAA